MNKYKKLFNNSIVLALGNFGSKFIVFFMLPLYTRYLTTNEYGKTDIVHTTVSLLLPIVSLSIFDAVLRFGMDKKIKKEIILSNGVIITFFGGLFSLLLGYILSYFKVEFSVYFSVILIVQSFQVLLSQFSKAIGKVKIFAINGIIISILTVIFNVYFLSILRMGIEGYFISIILSNLFSIIFLYIKIKIKVYFNFKYFDIKFLKLMLSFSIPQIPNSIAWWLTNAVGRYFILFFLGSAANGIFAVSNKIPTVLSVLNSVFTQSWQLSAIEEGESDKRTDFYSAIFDIYSRILFLSSSFILLFLKPIITVLVSKEFYESWMYVPFLLLSVIYSSFAGFYGQNYIVMKKTNGLFITTIVGAIINVIGNIILIPIIGLNGVGISSSISYFIVWITRTITTNKYVNIDLNISNLIINNILMVTQIIISLSFNSSIIVQIIIFILMLFTNRKIISLVTHKIGMKD